MKILRSRVALTLAVCSVLVGGVWAADLFQTLAGTISPPGYVAADRWGYQTAEKVRVNFNTLNTYIKGGTGTPEGAVTGGVGATYHRTDGACGTTFYIKESGSGNTGWRAAPCNNLSNQFFTVSGPASSLKTFTFPNASAIVLTDNALVTVAQGGHGSAPASDDQVFVSSSTTAGAWKTVSDCTGSNKAVQYDQSTNAWGCATITGGGGGGVGTVTNTGTLTSGKAIVGNGSADVTVSSLSAQFVGSSSGTAAAASMSTARILGRTTASSGAVEEITVGTGLSLSAGALTATGGSAGALVLLESYSPSAATAGCVFGTRNASGQSGDSFQTDYDDYIVKLITLVSGAASDMRVDLSGTSGGGSWIGGTAYVNYSTYGYSGGVGPLYATNEATFRMRQSNSTLLSGSSWNGQLEITDPLSTTLHKNVSGFVHLHENSIGPLELTFRGTFSTTATAIKAIRVLFHDSVNPIAMTGTCRLYGVAK
jgi:hypothetical protein